ncbi:TonB-dependent receptor [Oleisolibacter albus]|uniref:TonB-dependent receptor n=1 Tax=Oleisolibacter albus TaxID=2171757 RepID=UPI000DF2045D|nr:TonB-dependent receptor [Oleisolibacter albus]
MSLFRTRILAGVSPAVLSLSVLSAMPAIAAAEDPPAAPAQVAALAADDATFTIGEVVVTGTRMARSSATLYSSVDRLGGDLLERQVVDSAWELMGRMPGVLLTDFNQGTTSGKFSFRGFNGEGEINAVKLLIDGIPSNSNDGNMPFLDMVFPLELAAVETVRGTADPRWGLHAIAGSADMQTRTGGNYQQARLTAGSFATFEGQAVAGIEEGGFSQNYMAAYRQSDGYRDHGDADRLSAAGKWFYTLGDGGTRVGAILRYARNNAEEAGYLTRVDAEERPSATNAYNATDRGRRRLAQGSLHLDTDLGDHADAMARAYVNRFKDRRWVQFSPGTSQQERVTDEWQYGGIAAVHYHVQDSGLHALMLEAGGDVQIQDNKSLRYLTRARQRTSQTRDQSFDLDVYGGYVQAVIEPTDFLKIVPAYRVDAVGGDHHDRLSGRGYDVNDYGTIDQPKISAALTPVDGVVVYGNWGRSFQIGVGSGAYKIPPRTTDLAASVNEGWETGVKLSPGRWLETRLAYWEQTASGEVKRKLNDPLGDFDNLGKTRRQGIDAQVNVRPLDWLELWLAVAWQKGEIREPDPASPATRGNRIDHVPSWLGSGGIDVQPTPDLRLSLWGNGQSSYYLESSNSKGKFGDYVLLTAEIAYQVTETVEASVQVKNLTNTDYAYVWWDGIQSLHSPGDKRAVYGTVTLRF